MKLYYIIYKHHLTRCLSQLNKITPTSLDPRIEKISLRSNNHPPLARKPKIRATLAKINLPNQCPLLIPNMHPITHTRINIPFRVSVYSIRDTSMDISEQLPILERSIILHIVSVDRSHVAGVVPKEAMSCACISHVQVAGGGGEADPVWSDELVGYDSYGACGVVVAVYLVGETGERTKVLQITVGYICEIEITISRIDGPIIERIEGSAEKVV
jgi:hypothetical protein